MFYPIRYLSPNGFLALVVLLVLDFVFLLAAVVSSGIVGWLLLNIIAVSIWLAIRKRRSSKKKKRQRQYFQEQPKSDS